MSTIKTDAKTKAERPESEPQGESAVNPCKHPLWGYDANNHWVMLNRAAFEAYRRELRAKLISKGLLNVNPRKNKWLFGDYAGLRHSRLDGKRYFPG